MDANKLRRDIDAWARELGFQGVGVSDTQLDEAGDNLNAWLARRYHGEMNYMQRHGSKRTHPLTTAGIKAKDSCQQD